MEPLVVGPPHVVVEVAPQLLDRGVAVPVHELLLQQPVRRLDHGVVIGVALAGKGSFDAEHVERLVDSRVVELAAAVRVEDLDVRDREPERGERGLDEPRVLPRARRVPDDLPVVQVDEQAHVVPRAADAHVREVAADVGPGRPAPEAPCDDVGHVRLVDGAGMHPEALPPIGADQPVLPHDAAYAAAADRDSGPAERRLYLARAVPALAGGMGRDHGRRDGVGRDGRVLPRPHGVVRRPGDAEEPALR